MSLFFRVSGIVLTLMVFLGCGVLIGAKRGVMASGRFQKVSDTTALDTWTGHMCSTVPVPTSRINPKTGERVPQIDPQTGEDVPIAPPSCATQ
jgi:hypothetical protein